MILRISLKYCMQRADAVYLNGLTTAPVMIVLPKFFCNSASVQGLSVKGCSLLARASSPGSGLPETQQKFLKPSPVARRAISNSSFGV